MTYNVSSSNRSVRSPPAHFPSVYKKLYITSQNILAFWLFVTYDLLENKCIDDDITIFSFLLKTDAIFCDRKHQKKPLDTKTVNWLPSKLTEMHAHEG